MFAVWKVLKIENNVLDSVWIKSDKLLYKPNIIAKEFY